MITTYLLANTSMKPNAHFWWEHLNKIILLAAFKFIWAINFNSHLHYTLEFDFLNKFRPKGNQPWTFNEGLMLKPNTGHQMQKLTYWKDLISGERLEGVEKRWQESVDA